MSDLRDYLESTGELPEDCILGWLVVWSVIDCDPGITPEFAKDMFTELELNPAFIPPVPKKIDAFRKATSTIKRELTLDNGKIITFLARDVLTDDVMVERHIIREERDGKRRVLGHTKAAEAVFYKQRPAKGSKRRVTEGSEAVRLNRCPKGYPAGEQDVIDDVLAEIQENYNTFTTHLDSQRIRSVIREYVRSLEAVTVKGGLYYVDKEHTEELRRLAEFMAKLPGRCRMNMLPLVDIEDSKAMIVEAFMTETVDEMNRITHKCAELLTNRTRITDEAYAQIRAEYDRIQERAFAYRSRLKVAELVDEVTAESALVAVNELALRYLDDNMPQGDVS